MGKGSGRRKFNKQAEEAYRNNPFWSLPDVKERKRQQEEGERRVRNGDS